jgi:hypothetical protein
LPGRAREAHPYRVVGQAFMAITTRDLTGQHRADRSVDVADRHFYRDFLSALERRRG